VRSALAGTVVAVTAVVAAAVFGASLLGSGLAALGTLLSWSRVAALGGYSYKSYHAYQVKKQDYALRLTKSLYFQTLDCNTGVLMRVLDEAEEQECRETFLAYFCLWLYAPPEGWNAEQLDDYVELYLEGNANLKVDFEIGDALEKLERLKIVRKSGDAAPEESEAIDGTFKYTYAELAAACERGEILDSFSVQDISLGGYLTRTNDYLAAFPNTVDVWEVGNEINGEWLVADGGTTADVVAKMSGAFDAVKAAGQRTALTLYFNQDCWQFPSNEMFTWANANVRDAQFRPRTRPTPLTALASTPLSPPASPRPSPASDPSSTSFEPSAKATPSDRSPGRDVSARIV